MLAEILAGGAEVAAAAGVAIGGGHSIDDPEPKYGMTVSGVVHPDELLTAAGGRPGDELYLTKPVGGGLITTAAKRGIAEAAWVEAAVEAMTTLNAEAAAAAARRRRPRAHRRHRLRPARPPARALRGAAASRPRSRRPPCRRCPAPSSWPPPARPKPAAAPATPPTPSASPPGPPGVSAERRALLTDAMTSGGLLAAVPPGVSMSGTRIGALVDGEAGRVAVL